MTPEEFLNTGLLEQYLMGLLSEEESTQVASYISKHPSVKKTYEELENTIYNLAESHQIRPPASLKEGVMHQIKSEKDIISSSSSKPWIKYLTGAAAVLLGIICILSYQKIDRLDAQLKEEKIAYENLESSCEASKKSFDTETKFYAFYKDSNTQSTVLKGNAKAPDLKLVSHYNKNKSQLILDLDNAQSIPENKMLCLWGDKEGKMILIAKIDESSLGKLVSFDSEMNSFNITLEDLQEEIDHPDVSQLVASVSI